MRVPETERMTDLVSDNVPQVIVLLLQISLRHRLGQDEDVCVQNLPSERVTLNV